MTNIAGHAEAFDVHGHYDEYSNIPPPLAKQFRSGNLKVVAECATQVRTAITIVSPLQGLMKMDAVAQKLMDYKPVPMLLDGRQSMYINYMRRFFYLQRNKDARA
ncbi:MAG: hypothetical protein ABI210_15440 [Abditibacteriaceae bacterium]